MLKSHTTCARNRPVKSLLLKPQQGIAGGAFDDSSDTVKTGESFGVGRHSAPAPVRPQLFVVMECDRPLSGGARYELTDVDEVLIGRGRERGFIRERVGRRVRLNLRLPGRSLSTVHARIVHDRGDWILEDAGSTNGTLVNGRRVERAVIGDSDCIEVGHTLLALRVAVPTPADALPDLDSLEHAAQTHGLLTLQPLLARDYAALAKVAGSALAIVLNGKTGTGKEVVARAVHRLSGRQGPFVAVNCGALVPSLVESQLFGHTQGAFSGAIRHELGFVRSADQGTLLLDEAGDLPVAAQAALLRVLQEFEVTPVGSPRAVHVDVRVIAATHEPLEQLVIARRLREDLRARLEGHVMELPPLHARREDLGILAASILSRLSVPRLMIRPSAARLLLSHDWPLNVRELEQVLRRAVALSDGELIVQEHLPNALRNTSVVYPGSEHPTAPPVGQNASGACLSPADQELWDRLVGLLKEYEGNISQVARSTGKARTQVQRWMRRFGIDPERYRKHAEYSGGQRP